MQTHKQLVARGQDIIRRAPQFYIDVDVEADGIPGCGSLLSIGAVTPWEETFYTELQPASEKYLPSNRAFAEAHNLERDRLLWQGEDPRVAARHFADWATNLATLHRKDGLVLAAFNASFDFPWIDLVMKEADVPNPFGVAGFCIKSLAMALPGGYDWGKTAKGSLPPELVPPGDFTHNALEDARYQQQIHFALAGKLALVGA